MMAPSRRVHTTSKRRYSAPLLALTLLWPVHAAAQHSVARPGRLPALGKAAATTDDSSALVLNPANLVHIPGAELRWSSLYMQERADLPWQGHAVSFAGRLPLLPLAAGIRLDWLIPPDGVNPLLSGNHRWFTWGLALPLGEYSSFGVTGQYAFSQESVVSDLSGYSLAYSVRPLDALAFSFTLHNVNAPDNNLLELGRSYHASLAIRPLQTRDLELAFETKHLEEESVWTPRAVVNVALGDWVQLRGDFEMNNPQKDERTWLASLGLSLYLNGMRGSAELAAGAVTGNALGLEDSYNPYVEVAARTFREPMGIQPRRYALLLPVEETPNARDHVTLLRQLWELNREPALDAVVLQLRAAPASNLARAQELRDALFELRRSGKRVLCQTDEGSGAALYVCAAANRALLHPAASVRFTGIHSQQVYLARLLEQLGIRAEFVRAGAHKSAPEVFTRTHASDEARADRVQLLQQFEQHFTGALSVGRQLSVERVRELVAQGPWIATAAQQAGLVDSIAYDDQLEGAVSELTGRSTPLHEDHRSRLAPKRFGRQGYVAVVHIQGEMVDDHEQWLPLLDIRTAGSFTIAETLEKLRRDPRAKAVVIRIDSPGGSSLAAERMWRQVQLTARSKPTVVSMGHVAASGGYYVASAAERIFANPLTLTGSIGVFQGKADLSQLLQRIGVDIETYKTQARADLESPFRPLAPAEREAVQRHVDELYRVFLERVAEGRKLRVEQVEQLAQGRVWTGEQARQHGLVDELGGLREAIAYARSRADLDDEAPIVEFPKRPGSLLSHFLGARASAPLLSAAQLPMNLRNLLQAAAPLLVHPQDVPMTRLEFTFPESE